jgi:hypothetical protein
VRDEFLESLVPPTFQKQVKQLPQVTLSDFSKHTHLPPVQTMPKVLKTVRRAAASPQFFVSSPKLTFTPINQAKK